MSSYLGDIGEDVGERYHETLGREAETDLFKIPPKDNLEFFGDGWNRIRPDLEVKLCRFPEEKDVFILCGSGARGKKEKAIHACFAARIDKGLRKIQKSCSKRKYSLEVIAENELAS